jgi:hypothetical protein
MSVPFHFLATGNSAVGFLDLGLFRSAVDGPLTLFRQQLFDCEQFETARFGCLGIRHLEIPQRIQNDLRDDQPCVLLVVSGDNEPWRTMRACRLKTILIGLHVMLPVFPLVNIGGAELPVLFRLVDAREKSLPLLLVRQMQKDLDDLRAITMKVLLQVRDGFIPLLPNVLPVAQLRGKSLAAENLRMHSDDQHFLVIGTVEDADAAALRKPARRAPEKVMFEFFSARLFEAEDFAALRIHAGHDVPDGAVFAGAVHALENEQQRIAVGRVVKLL